MNPMKQRLLLAGILGLGACAKQTSAPAGPPEAVVSGNTVSYPANAPQLAYLTLEAAEPRRLAVTHLTGRLYLPEDATVRVFTPVSGQVTRVRAAVGESIPLGGPLAEISSPDYGQALADARTASAALVAAEKAQARAKDLLEHGAAAAKDVEAAEAAYEGARAERDRADARLRLYHGSGDGADEVYVLRSPIAGTVVERNVNPGQEVRNDQMLANATNLFAPLFVVSNPSTLWIQIDASESDLAEIQVGQAIRVAANALPGRTFGGAVASIGPSLDPATRSARVQGVVDNPGGVLKAEMYVSVDVVRDESRIAQAGVEIPSKAVFTVDQKAYLFVEASPGRFERREVEIGTEKDGKVPVERGVAAGERVVTDGGLLLQAVLNPAD